MRLAVISDIHANPIALDAILSDIEAEGGADGYIALGDLLGQGYDPVSVATRLALLPDARCIRGNTDRYVSHAKLPHWMDLSTATPERLAGLVTAAQGHAWATGVLTESGWLDWVRDLPLELRGELPDGTRVLCVHASPGTDEGTGITPAQTDQEVEQLIQGCDADLILTGHTHWPLDRTVGGVRIVNPGSVSYPYYPDLRASYALIEADASGHQITQHRVEFDIAAVIDAIRASGYFPNPEWLVQPTPANAVRRGTRRASQPLSYPRIRSKASPSRKDLPWPPPIPPSSPSPKPRS